MSGKTSSPSQSPRSSGKPPRRWGRFLLISLAVLFLCFAVALASYFFHLSNEIRSRFESRKWSIPSRVFSSSVPVYPGQDLSLSQVKKMFERRRYREAFKGKPQAGEYKIGQEVLAVHLREFHFPGRRLPERSVVFHFNGKGLERIQGPDGDIAFLELEPMELARLFGPDKESRLLVNIDRAPQSLVEAVVAIEDHRFYEHPGVDWWGIARALWADLRAGRVVQGGSTITQQLIKNYFLKPERTLKRKMVEACMAVVMEMLYSKDEILEMYMNEIYLGQKGGVAIHGMGEAASFHFGRNVEDLTLAESAVLAGMIRAPSRYSPQRHPEAAKERRNVVLSRLLDLGRISPEEYEKARHEPLRVVKAPPHSRTAPYFVDYVRRQLQELYEPEVLEREGLSIYTTLHPEMAWAAREAVREGLKNLEKQHPYLKQKSTEEHPLQAALIVVQPKTGSVVALVGGRSYGESPYNRALVARRQPGSAIKPFVYLTALGEFTPVTWLSDERMTYNIGGATWSPRNYSGRYRGPIMVRTALEKSLNAATVHLAMTVGLERIIDTIHSLGIRSELKPYPSLALGAFEVTPIEMARAYATLDNDGQRPYLLSLKEVVSANGEVQQRRNVDIVSVTTPAKAFVVTSLLQGVVERGTAAGLRKLGIDFPCAGKTGTTSDYRDSWFAGYTPDLVALVWVGFDDNEPTKLTGASGALRIWADFFNRVRHLIPAQSFRVPPGVAARDVCLDSGDLATPFCPRVRKEYFLEERVPGRHCPFHHRSQGWKESSASKPELQSGGR